MDKNMVFLIISLIVIIFLVFWVGFVFDKPTNCITNVTFSCMVYEDKSMSCNPIDRTSNVTNIFKTPCMTNVTKVILCDYDIINNIFISCREFNQSISF